MLRPPPATVTPARRPRPSPTHGGERNRQRRGARALISDTIRVMYDNIETRPGGLFKTDDGYVDANGKPVAAKDAAKYVPDPADMPSAQLAGYGLPVNPLAAATFAALAGGQAAAATTPAPDAASAASTADLDAMRAELDALRARNAELEANAQPAGGDADDAPGGDAAGGGDAKKK